jgi:hypothetical protein
MEIGGVQELKCLQDRPAVSSAKVLSAKVRKNLSEKTRFG